MKLITISVALTMLMLLLLAACAEPQRSHQPGKAPAEAVKQPAQPIADSGNKDVEHVKNVVNTRSGKLQAMYQHQSSIQAMTGSLNIKLFITEQGVVQNAEIIPDSGNLSAEFIQAVKQEILTWRFLLREQMIYSFKMQFKKM